MPVLDLGMFVERGRAKITFYQKSMSSPFVNMYRLAVSAKTKRDSLLMEGIRRLRNISTGVSATERRNILGRFMNTLRLSGYNSKYRSERLRLRD